VAVAGVALGFELVNRSRPPAVASQSAPSVRRPASSARSATAPARSATAPARPATTAAVPPATTAPVLPAVLVSASGGTATYQLTSPAASIVVKATGPCWIEVKAGSPAGEVVVEETLSAGQSSSVTGPAWIRLGDPPHVAVTVDGTPMSVPGAGTAVPLDLQFTLG
jgi:cytoskeletal protein RodZ